MKTNISLLGLFGLLMISSDASLWLQGTQAVKKVEVNLNFFGHNSEKKSVQAILRASKRLFSQPDGRACECAARRAFFLVGFCAAFS